MLQFKERVEIGGEEGRAKSVVRRAVVGEEVDWWSWGWVAVFGSWFALSGVGGH